MEGNVAREFFRLVLERLAVSQRERKLVAELLGWLNTVRLMRRTRHGGKARVGWMFTFTVAAYNLVRVRKLLAVAA